MIFDDILNIFDLPEMVARGICEVAESEFVVQIEIAGLLETMGPIFNPYSGIFHKQSVAYNFAGGTIEFLVEF